jgi:hypothetical protein
MRYLTLLILLFSFSIYAQEKEGDLQLPVSDLEIEKQEEEMPPTLEEVEMNHGTEQEDESYHRGDRSRGPDGSEDTKRRKY